MARRRLRNGRIHGNNQAIIRRLRDRRDRSVDSSGIVCAIARKCGRHPVSSRRRPLDAFANERFDVAVSALVLNFIPDRGKAVSEMRRVVRLGGTAAAYVWDFAGRRGTSQHLHSAVMELEGPGYRPAGLNAESTTQENLKALFEAAGLTDVVTHSFEISVTHRDFDDYWDSHTEIHFADRQPYSEHDGRASTETKTDGES